MERYELLERGGEPIALFHGFLGQPSMWDDVVAHLSTGRFALARLPGHGPTPWHPARNGFLDAVDDLADALPFERAVLVGYSMGGRVALALALRHPTRVSGVVLIGVHPGLDDAAERSARAASDDAKAARVLAAGLPTFVAEWERQPILSSQAPELVRRQRAERLAHTEAGIAWALRNLGLGRMPPQRSALATSTLPLALVTGTLDAKFDAVATDMVTAAPQTTHTRVPGVGHNTVLEAPEAVSDQVRRMVAANTASNLV